MATMMDEPKSSADWRKQMRRSLLERRKAMPQTQRLEAEQHIHNLIMGPLKDMIPHLDQTSIGFYWPHMGEVDLRPVICTLVASGAQALLPVVTGKDSPLVFHIWQPDMKMQPGTFGIPIPAVSRPGSPSVLFVPMLGHDRAGFRLGYGGGYYDRTLAVLSPRPITVGIGYADGYMETVHPNGTDIALDIILTENGITSRFGHNIVTSDTESLASPPCSMKDMDQSYFGYLDNDDILALLNRLLEAERAGARAVAALSKQAKSTQSRDLLNEIAGDEARFCAMLSGHIRRLGAEPSRKTGSFYDRLMTTKDEIDRLVLLNRGQGWVARTIRDALPTIHDDSLYADLKNMLNVHEDNIRLCNFV